MNDKEIMVIPLALCGMSLAKLVRRPSGTKAKFECPDKRHRNNIMKQAHVYALRAEGTVKTRMAAMYEDGTFTVEVEVLKQGVPCRKYERK